MSSRQKRWTSLFLCVVMATQTGAVHPHNCWWPVGRTVIGLAGMVASAAAGPMGVGSFFVGMIAVAASTSEFAACMEGRT